MIEAVENHMPQVIVIDEIGTELEAAAARTIAERGVQLVATAHGNALGNLLVNPTLSDLVGGIQTVTLGDEEARRRHTQKSILERKAPPTFNVVVEQQSWEELIVHCDVADTVDNMLRGQPVVAERRTRDPETEQVLIHRVSTGGMEVPTWGSGGLTLARPDYGFSPSTFDRANRSERYDRNGNGGKGALRHIGHNRSQVRALAPTGTAPADVEPRSAATLVADSSVVTESIFPDEDVELSALKTLRVYPFGVSRDRLAESARQLHLPVIVMNNQDDADAVITIKNYYRRQPERLQKAEQERKLIIILKSNTVTQIQHALARIFDLPEIPASSEQEEEDSTCLETDDSTKRAMLETEDAIHQVLNKGLTTTELAPANAYIRRLQHQMATRYNLFSRSRGKEPHRRVKIFRVKD
jgi:hypothetical protein